MKISNLHFFRGEFKETELDDKVWGLEYILDRGDLFGYCIKIMTLKPGWHSYSREHYYAIR